TSEPIPVADNTTNFDVSQNGVLIYLAVSPKTDATSTFFWFDRAGRQMSQLGEMANYNGLEFSPDGQRVATDINVNGYTDVWTVDLERSVPVRITFEQPASNHVAIWSPDGSQIGFVSNRNGNEKLYVKSATGAGDDQLIFTGDRTEILYPRQ